jgi:hypothetical protein
MGRHRSDRLSGQSWARLLRYDGMRLPAVPGARVAYGKREA